MALLHWSLNVTRYVRAILRPSGYLRRSGAFPSIWLQSSNENDRDTIAVGPNGRLNFDDMGNKTVTCHGDEKLIRLYRI